MQYHNFDIQLKCEFIKSKGMYMWVYYDASGNYPYDYIDKMKDKPTKRQHRWMMFYCLDRCKRHQYWEEM